MAHTRIRTRSAGLAAAALVLGGFVVAASAPGPARAATPELVDTFSVGYFPFALAVSPDGGTLYVANAGDGTVMAVDTATGTAGPPSRSATFPRRSR
ncbi:YncE family protein [Homoserinibacter gongjuensis]|uniref:YncE family protein n=1 Tax=Homoserinibacter gongjuensis TaxID=1162968 RepID=A0ABQ6JR17_9MICO|nr:hypothetical protein [Homoserinibacter gongjuensis]GMA90718.1 hypothetical protein GCM10025869_12470 [Homoserinibacter gongjuensis]